ncbi:hypothetical protein [Proteiniphilum sp.]|uniref:hypothetical protein n=1 Tax=Proteiniphilum sp. TaxID=1926877 RepID=UPI003A598B77
MKRIIIVITVLIIYVITACSQVYMTGDIERLYSGHGPYTVTGLRYLIRNDDNAIRPGDRYELVYWDRGQWISLGKQIAQEAKLKYDDVPTGALFLLHNHTRGKEERPFTYENGQQVWW